jgi:hypothetical protein
MRIAYHEPTPDCETVRFRNHGLLPVFVEPYALIRGTEFVAARLIGPDEDDVYSVEVELRETASRKISDLAKRSRTIGLAVFRWGEPIQLIQAVRGISGRTLAWHGFLSEDEAREMLDLFGPVASVPPGA